MQTLIRTGAHDEADALLEGLFVRRPSELGDLCLNLPESAVVIHGWDELAQRLQTLSVQIGSITAVGVDLTSQVSGQQGHGWREQMLETNYYTDLPFCFSQATPDEILAHSGPEGSAWQGHFVEIDRILSVQGLNQVNTRLTAENQTDEVSLRAGEWFRHLRFHQAAKRGMAARGEGLPLLVGTNEVGPWIEAVYFPASRQSFAGPSQEAQDTETRQKAQNYAQQTERDVAVLLGTRARLLKLRNQGDEDYGVALEYARRHENVHYRHSPAMQQFGYCDTLPDAEFRLYIQAYREQQEAYRTGKPLPTTKPTSAAGRAM